ncbi:TYRO protein tyrosine kinase-binding protein isoform X2 [Kryptolebias marmoratus]|uniref:TYRO protein tyrosine kinase-binding protein isoform X2 n=1 Tax=Kryptolebias marmoratus TaxID=37003 RepID=UPI000D52F5FD|nr:TYRO protein tyrosine kinase-binding protein isoform X2 [Kryptolebias marmoratus]
MSDALCIEGSFFGSEEGQQADIVLTVFITISVFCFATCHRRRRERDSPDSKRSLPLSASKKRAAEVTESPYQELHGVQSDIYSELRHYRK